MGAEAWRFAPDTACIRNGDSSESIWSVHDGQCEEAVVKLFRLFFFPLSFIFFQQPVNTLHCCHRRTCHCMYRDLYATQGLESLNVLLCT